MSISLKQDGGQAEPVLPDLVRRTGSDPGLDKPRQRKPRPSAAQALADLERIATTQPEAEADALRAMVDQRQDDAEFLGWASDRFLQLAGAERHDGLPDPDLITAAWATLLCAVLPRVSDDALGLALITRTERIYDQTQRHTPPLGHWQQFETAVSSFGLAGPRSALAAASLLTASNPALALQLAQAADDGLGRVLICASAHAGLGHVEEAAGLFDQLGRWGHSPLQLALDDRFDWVQTMTEVGRFPEAETVCAETLRRLRLWRDARRAGMGVDAGGEDDPTGHWAHVYAIMAGRLAHLQGRFVEGWELLRAASDDDAESPPLRRSALRLRLIFADRPAAAAALRQLEEIADSDTDPAGAATFIDAALWAAGQWAADAPAADADADYFRSARLRGQVAARALLARHGPSLDRSHQLRLALLAGDDRLAEKLLADAPLTTEDLWPTRVLAAVLCLRTGRDADASRLLEEVLATRRHDMELRVLQAQAALFSGDSQGALADALACTAAMPDHLMARVVQAESAFEAALARADTDPDGHRSAESAHQLIRACADYRRAADLHVSTRTYLTTGRTSGGVGSEPLSPRLFEEVCRRGLHAAIVAQEALDRLGLRGDTALQADAAALLQHLRGVTHACCSGPLRGRLAAAWHRRTHRRDRDEAARLSELLVSHAGYLRRNRLQNLGFIVLGVIVLGLALTDTLPPPPSEAIRTTVLAVGVLLTLTPFAKTLRIGVVELERAEATRPAFGRSKALRTSSLMQRGYHLGAFALPATPDVGRGRRGVVEAELAAH